MICDGKAGYKLNTQMSARISMFQPHVALPKLVNTFWEVVFGVPGSCWQA